MSYHMNNATTQKICIAIDLNGVVLGLSIRKMAGIVLKSRQLHHFILLGLNPRFLCAMIQGLHKEPIVEQAFEKLIRKFPRLKNVEATAFAIINAQHPKRGMIGFLEQLRADGHTLVAFSNIGPKSIAALRTQHPELFKLFHNIVTPSQEFMIGKPDSRAYERLISLYADAHHKIILIDDQKINLHAAKQHGIQGVHFKSARLAHKELANILS